MRGLHPLALRNIDDLRTAIFGFGILQVLGTHALGYQPFGADAKLRDQIEAHRFRPLLGQIDVEIGVSLAIAVPGDEKGVARSRSTLNAPALSERLGPACPGAEAAGIGDAGVAGVALELLDQLLDGVVLSIGLDLAKGLRESWHIRAPRPGP